MGDNRKKLKTKDDLTYILLYFSAKMRYRSIFELPTLELQAATRSQSYIFELPQEPQESYDDK